MAENSGGMGSFLGTNLLQAATRKLLQTVTRLDQVVSTTSFTESASHAGPPEVTVLPGMGTVPTQVGPSRSSSNKTPSNVVPEKPAVGGASAALGGIAAAVVAYGQAKMPAQLALNALQVQSAFGAPPGQTNSSTFTQTRVAALGTGQGTGQVFAQSTTDALMGYSTLQQIAGQSSVNASAVGRAAKQQMAMGAYANPGMSMKQAANISAWMYRPMTSYSMMQMGYPIQPRRFGANRANQINSPAEVQAGMLLKWDRGGIPKPSTLRHWLSNGGIAAGNLKALGAPAGFGAEMLSTDQLFSGGPNGSLPRMKVGQVNQIYKTLDNPDTTADQKQKVENQLAKYGVSKSEVMSIQTANGASQTSLSDQSSAFAQTLKSTTNALTTIQMKISGELKATGADKMMGHVGGTTGAFHGANVGGGGFTRALGKFTHSVGSIVSNVRGGGSRTMYDSLDLTSIPTDAQMVAYYPHDPRTSGSTSLFKNATLVTISNSAGNPDCDVLDVEPGAAPSSYITTFLKAHQSAGDTGTIYTNTSSWDSVKSQVGTLPVDYWVADWTGTAPSGGLAGAIGVQYATSSGYDTSIITDNNWPPGAHHSGSGGSSSASATASIDIDGSGLTASLLAGESIASEKEGETVTGAATGSISAGSGFYGDKGGAGAGFSSMTDFAGTSPTTTNGGQTSVTSSKAASTGAASTGGSGTTAGYDMANLLTIAKYMMAHGYQRAAAAGIAGCIAGESGGNPESSGSGGDGLIGWTPPSTGPPLTGNAAADLVTQEAAIVTYNQNNGSSNIATLNAETNPVSAADFYSQSFERPAVTDSDVKSAVATTIYSELSGTKTTGNASGSASGASSKTSSSSATGKAASGVGASVHAIDMGSSGLGLGTGDTTNMGSTSELEATMAGLGGGISVPGGLGQFGITLGGESSTSGGGAGGQKAIAAYAETFATGLKHPYVYDGSSPTTGWDCVGFASYVWYHFGIDVPDFKPGVDHPFACDTIWASSFFKHVKDPVLGAFLMEAGSDGTVSNPGHVGIITSTNPLQMVAAADTAEGTVFETPTQISGYMVPAAGFPSGGAPSNTGTLANGGGTATTSSKATSVNPNAAGGYAQAGELLQVGERGPELIVDATAHQMAGQLAQSTVKKNLSLDIGKGEIELTLPENTDLSDSDKVGEMLADMLITRIAGNSKVRRAVSA